MKKRLRLLITVLLIFCLSACSGNTDMDSGSEGASKADSAEASSETISETGIEGGSSEMEASMTDPAQGNGSSRTRSTQNYGTKSMPSTPDTIVTIPNDGYNVNMLVGVDQFGRTFDSISSIKSNKKVGMFFWLWMGQPYASGLYDATKIASMSGGQDILYKNTSTTSPDGQAHFWGEPLWGYYNSIDEWVIRRQLKMLTQAGVDFLVFDATNTFTYNVVYSKLMKIITELQNEGWNPPLCAFYTHSRSMQTTIQLYNELYKSGRYSNTWYKVNGKPMIIAYTDPALDKAEADSRGDSSYTPPSYSAEITNFFHFNKPQWPSDPVLEDGFPWIEWTYPQPLHTITNMMSVTVASHPAVPFSFSETRGAINWGRGWDPISRMNLSHNVDEGTFFQDQWNQAIKANPETIFVGGWNEWIAYKQLYMGEYALVDACSKQYSRDIEPMVGGYEDAFFLQLIQNVRKFKGAGTSVSAPAQKTININGSLDQWNSVSAVYRDVGKAAIARNEYSASQIKRYQSAAPRNNITDVKVSHDSNNIYFLINCEKNITSPSGENWMNIFLSAGAPKAQGWQSYTHVINRNVSGSKGTVSSLKSDFSATKTGDADIKISGNTLQVKVSKASIGASGASSFYFKVSDGVDKASDIMNTYITGDSLPMGRLSYKYVLK